MAQHAPIARAGVFRVAAPWGFETPPNKPGRPGHNNGLNQPLASNWNHDELLAPKPSPRAAIQK
eukprot:4001614-Lingulodinium_polyedra.AAC.1